ncbi:MAG: DUF378 domain-containing protein [Ruminococcaceae bacterium]|nr:DUF378 domain-containing protein [Oscillospiraceae bacterium]
MARNGLDRFALILIIIGALNWLSVGLFQFDIVAALFGGATHLISRIIYSLVGIAGIYSVSLLFRTSPENERV